MNTTTTSVTKRHLVSITINKLKSFHRRHNNKRSLPQLTVATLRRIRFNPNLLCQIQAINERTFSNRSFLPINSYNYKNSTQTRQHTVSIRNTHTTLNRTTARLNPNRIHSVTRGPRRQRINKSVRLLILTVSVRNRRCKCPRARNILGNSL